MNRPIWLLDVDGVLNASRPGWGGTPRSGTAYSGGHSYRLRWAPRLVDRIRALHSAGGVTVRWCSTWCADARQIEQLLGLPSWERAWTDPISSAEAHHAKLAAARTVLSQGHRLIWTDDEALPPPGPVRDELVAAGHALLIAPLPNRGLQPEHLDAIDEFLGTDTGFRSDDGNPDPVQRALRLLGGTGYGDH